MRTVCGEGKKKTTKKRLEKASRPPQARPAFCADVRSEVRAGLGRTAPLRSSEILECVKCPFPGRGWRGPPGPQGGQGAAGDPLELPRARPATPNSLPGERRKFDNVEAFSGCLRVLSQPQHRRVPFSPGMARPRSGPRSLMDLICDLLISPEQIRL